MSVSVTRVGGVTVVTLTSRPHSLCPPLWQIIGGLFCSPACCTVTPPLKSLRSSSPSVLGTLQVMVGVFSVALALILTKSLSPGWWGFTSSSFPVWMGCLFVSCGIVNILCDWFPTQCLLFTNAVVQLIGVCFAVMAVGLYGANMAATGTDIDCHVPRPVANDWWRRQQAPPTTLSPSLQDQLLRDTCLEGREILQVVQTSVEALLVFLAVLELCVVVSAAAIAVKKVNALEVLTSDGNKSSEDIEDCRPLVVEV